MRELRLSPILDVGAAQGMLGHLIQDTGLTIDGIEANPQWAEMARPHYRNVWASYVEQAPLEPNTYNLIVCGDVLEHTPDHNKIPMAIIDQHVDAVRAIVREYEREDIVQMATSLTGRLRQVTDEFLIVENRHRPEYIQSITSPPLA